MKAKDWVSLVTAVVALIAAFLSHMQLGDKADQASLVQTYDAVTPVVNDIATEVEKLHELLSKLDTGANPAANGEPEPDAGAAAVMSPSPTEVPPAIPLVVPPVPQPALLLPLPAPVPAPAPAPAVEPVQVFKLKRLPLRFDEMMQQQSPVLPLLPPKSTL